ncbi:hypothetical protein C8Q72DRAFT_79723 [Fomitopsis betulina]|nr:hypothetical protein C8Q72DRAFT_79723 [Fomitopsis betulina]
MHHVPPLPIEIVEQAVDYLRYDPPNLLSCALVCRAWASRSCYFLRREETLTIRSAAEMYLYGSLLASKRSRGLYAKVRVLRMIDNPTRPFVHILPLCFPGQYLPEAATVVLENINWSITHPHPLFFSCLSRFASVSGICLHECTLRPAHAQRIARSLPKLETVVENSVDPVSLPKATMLFQSILIGTERELNLHQRMHPDAQHQDLSQGALSHHFEAFVAFMHIAKVCALVSAGLSLHTGPAFQHTAPSTPVNSMPTHPQRANSLSVARPVSPTVAPEPNIAESRVFAFLGGHHQGQVTLIQLRTDSRGGSFTSMTYSTHGNVRSRVQNRVCVH